ncbi:MAG TPA: AbrB/MazE/SpoVT family DNA-binding domain-containing protein [Terracidiphilus sp.]|nr:AbrB/MazE/SpoVT family DNA-binding domain-containing protein [Terracidiphilus sp.]
MQSAVVTFNGRITLPPHVRKQLGLKTGDTVEFVEVEKGRFSILPVPTAIDVNKPWMRLDQEEAEEVGEAAR